MVLVERLMVRDHLEDLGVDERMVLKWIFMKLDGGKDCFDLGQDSDSWRAFVNCTHDVAGHRPATSWVHYTTSCNTQSSIPEDG